LNEKHYSFRSVRYRVREPLLAVCNQPGMPSAFTTIERGAVIMVKGEVEKSGFVDVSYHGQIVKVFMRDIDNNADRVEGQMGSA
jgi:hypothetical protein